MLRDWNGHLVEPHPANPQPDEPHQVWPDWIFLARDLPIDTRRGV